MSEPAPVFNEKHYPDHYPAPQAIGSMGSAFWQYQVPPDLIPHIADKIDWDRLGRRVLIDPIAGIISWMSPSGRHEIFAEATDDIVTATGDIINSEIRGVRGKCWKRPEDPKPTGMEADTSYYIGTKAEGWITAFRTGLAEGGETLAEERASAYEKENPPDLVVEIEITNLDRTKPNKYARLGVREMWQVTRIRKDDQLKTEVRILELQVEGGPCEVSQSRVLPGLKADVLPEVYLLARARMLVELHEFLVRELPTPVPVQEVKKIDPSPSGPRM